MRQGLWIGESHASTPLRAAPLKAPVNYFLTYLSITRVESATLYVGCLFKNVFDSANFKDHPFVPLAYLTKKVMHLFVLWLNLSLLSPAFPHSAQDISPANTRGLITQSASRSHAPRQAPWRFSQ
jgi:hypothetical protein